MAKRAAAFMLRPDTMISRPLQEYGDHFSFSLQLEHPRFGCLVYQLARFVDEQTLTSPAAEASNFPMHEIHDVSNSSIR